MNASFLQELQTALHQTLVDVPYNSAQQFLEHFGGQQVDVRLGVSCVHQTVHSAELVQRKTGVSATLLRDGRHVAAYYREGDCLAVLDPYLLPNTPLLLDARDAQDGQAVVSVDAYPIRQSQDNPGGTEPSRLRATWHIEAHTLQLDYLRYSPRRGHRYLHRSFGFNLGQHAVYPTPKATLSEVLLHPEQNNLSVRVLHPTHRTLSEVIYPLACLPEGVKASSLVSKNNQGQVSRFGEPGFNEDIAAVADALGQPRAVIEALLLQAAEVYRSVAPADRALAAYSLENE
jgi:hypothetical protein